MRAAIVGCYEDFREDYAEINIKMFGSMFKEKLKKSLLHTDTNEETDALLANLIQVVNIKNSSVKAKDDKTHRYANKLFTDLSASIQKDLSQNDLSDRIENNLNDNTREILKILEIEAPSVELTQNLAPSLSAMSQNS